MSFIESDVQQELRASVAKLAERYNYLDYVLPKARSGEPLTELWNEAGKLGFLGVNLPEEYGGGAGIYELALVQEELAANGAGLLLAVVSPAICGTVIAKYGTEHQRRRWLPGIGDGSSIMAFAITEPDAGSNSHHITTTARPDGDSWVLNGQKVFISGVDQADAVLVVARTEDHKTGRLRPALFIVPTNSPNFVAQPMEMDITAPDRQFTLFLDEVRLPDEALLGEQDAALLQLFAGLNPERILGAAMAVGTGRYALSRAVEYANDRAVWKAPIGTHQGLSHPLAQMKVEVEMARLMMQKAAVLYDSGDDDGAGEAANMAKYAAAEASIRALDQAIQTHGGSGLTREHGLSAMLATARVARVAPVSREMILNFVAQHSLGLPKSY